MGKPDQFVMPPNSLDSERAVLGAILRDNRTLAEVGEFIDQSDFYAFPNALVFGAMVQLINAGKPADIVTVRDVIQARQQEVDFGQAGSRAYLVDLWDVMTMPYNARHHAALVRRTSVQRSLIHVGNEIAKLAGCPGAEPDDLIDQAERRVFAIANRMTTGSIIDQTKAVDDCLKDLDRKSGRTVDGECRGVPISTGWESLDNLTGGLFASELTVIGARPSIGKTMVGVCIARAVAGSGHGVFVASLEQTAVEIACRLFAAEAPIESHRLRHGDIDLTERERLLDAADRLRGLPIYYDDRGTQSMMAITSNARRLKLQKGIRLVLIDYLQLVQPPAKRDSRRTEEVGLMARQMKALAKELGVPVIALAQLNREVESRVNNEPRLSDLRDSGEIEQHADNVWLLHAPNGDGGAETILEIKVAKSRQGPRGTATMIHDKPHFRLRSTSMI